MKRRLSEADRARQSLGGFKGTAVRRRSGAVVSLARADLVAAMPAGLLATSKIEPDRGVMFHFILDASRGDTWS